MYSNKEYLKILLKKFEAGECNNEELKVIDEWYNSLNEIDEDYIEVNDISKMEIKNEIWGKIIRELKKTKKKHF